MSDSSTMKGLYRMYERGRYLLVRTFGCPMPGLSNFVPFIGGRTAFEVIVFILSFIACLSVAAEDAEGTAGNTIDKLIFITVMLAMRNNPLMIVFGMSFERAIYVHKAFGLITFGIMFVHITTGFNSTGIVLLICLIIVCTSYLVKNYNFELFYFAHIISYLVIVIVAYLHGGSMATMSIMFFAADVIVRYLIRGRTVKATAQLLPGEVVKITFPKCFDYEAGQFVFLRIAELSPVEYHPFSICSSPLEKDVVISIRALGDWTRSLAKMAEKADKIELSIQVEGPFGNPSIDLYGPDYKFYLLISGGIGVAPMQGIYNQLILENNPERKLRKVLFVWSVRDKVMVSDLEANRLRAENRTVQTADGTASAVLKDVPVSFQPAHVLTSERMSNAETTNPMMTDVTLDSPISAKSGGGPVNISDLDSVTSPFLFHSDFYLTGARSRDSISDVGLADDKTVYMHSGRPDFPELFKKITALCTAERIPRVAVCVCGPAAMTNEVDDLCRASQLACGEVIFDCHKEIFDF